MFYVFSIIVYSQITILWTRNNNTYNTQKIAAKHVTNSRLISAFSTFKPFISHNRIYRNRKKNFVGCFGCRIMTPIDKTPFICRFFLTFYTIINWPSIQRGDLKRLYTTMFHFLITLKKCANSQLKDWWLRSF